MKRVIHLGSLIIVLSLLTILILNYWVIRQTENRMYGEVDQLPKQKLGLVLGTSKYLVEGGVNPYFQSRIEAAAMLYQANKISHILVSGDNSSRYYNEPKLMKEGLIQMGVPEAHITLDYAGLRTLDSIVRCNQIFGQEEFVIITQEYHNYRALFIAQYYDLKAIGFSAHSGVQDHFHNLIREWLARPLAVVDLYILGTSPKYLGDKIPLDI